mmetsp:Transcript_43068/g.69915  ORF Transcript_43068/g.69915 Transcript_43068/m.69915 type:complete len:353 (-) Transcript_43068:127-1185(-)
MERLLRSKVPSILVSLRVPPGLFFAFHLSNSASSSGGARTDVRHGRPAGWLPEARISPPQSTNTFSKPLSFKRSTSMSTASPLQMPPRSKDTFGCFLITWPSSVRVRLFVYPTDAATLATASTVGTLPFSSWSLHNFQRGPTVISNRPPLNLLISNASFMILNKGLDTSIPGAPAGAALRRDTSDSMFQLLKTVSISVNTSSITRCNSLRLDSSAVTIILYPMVIVMPSKMTTRLSPLPFVSESPGTNFGKVIIFLSFFFGARDPNRSSPPPPPPPFTYDAEDVESTGFGGGGLGCGFGFIEGWLCDGWRGNDVCGLLATPLAPDTTGDATFAGLLSSQPIDRTQRTPAKSI